MSTPARRQAQVDPWQDPNAEPILRIEGVTKTFGKTYAVDDVSLDIFRGEFFALLAEAIFANPFSTGGDRVEEMLAGRAPRPRDPNEHAFLARRAPAWEHR